MAGPFPACSEPGKDDFGLDISLLCHWVPTPLYLLKHDPRPVHARPVAAGNPGLNDLAAQGGYEDLLLSGRPELDAGKPPGGWIGPENLRFALEGEDYGEWRDDRHAKEFPPFVAEEDQPGVAIDPDTGSSMQGMLYALKSLRFEHNAGFAGWFDGIADDRIPNGAMAGGTVGAGRKNRAAVVEKTADTHPDWRHIFEGRHLPREPEENRLFWLAATGPVAVADPLRPEIAAQPPEGVRIFVRGMVAGKPRVMGGFQMATGRTRPNRLYLPGGSAWLVQIAGGSPGVG